VVVRCSFLLVFSPRRRGPPHHPRSASAQPADVRAPKRVLQSFKQSLGVDVADHAEQAVSPSKFARCLGACGIAPACWGQRRFTRAFKTDTRSRIRTYYE